MSGEGLEELRLAVGSVTVGLETNDNAFRERVERIARPFVVNDEPDFRLRIRLSDRHAPEDVERMIFNLHRVDIRTLIPEESVRPHLEVSGREIAIDVHRELFDFDSPNRPRLLNVMMCAAYNTVIERGRGGARASFLMHACGVRTGGRGFVFTGPSGAGKTTMAGLAGDRDLLNDETVLVTRDGGGFRVEGAPFIGGVERRAAGGAPLEAIHWLEHGPTNGTEPVRGSEAFWCVLSQLLQTAPLFPSEDEHKASVRERARFAADVVAAVPVVRLRFVPDEAVWNTVERRPART